MLLDWLESLMVARLSYMERKLHITRRAYEIEMEHREREQQLIAQDNECESCETLRLELSRAHDENMRLIEVITRKPEVEKPIDTSEFKPINQGRHVPFAVRRQILEQEDRAKARTIAERQKQESESVVDETLTAGLEKEMQIVSAEREAESGVRDERIG